MNGGLVSAVAGRDYVIIASDTRLSDGYEILTRQHLSSRIWSVVPMNHYFVQDIENENENESIHDIMYGSSSSSKRSNNKKGNNMIQNDGSISLPNHHDNGEGAITHFLSSSSSPTFIASAGCSSDCEALKRQLRIEINAHVHWNHGYQTLTPSGIANLLGQTLYARRGFPFYSFCILAGIDYCHKDDANNDNYNDGNDNHGVVHIYDAIGSHERVAVATAGTGKEMLQPILDQFFSTAQEASSPTKSSSSSSFFQRDGKAVMASKQRVGLKLRPPVETFVSCSSDEAVSLLVKGYRSVAEREIAVGDNIVVCVIQRCPPCRSSSNQDIEENQSEEQKQSSKFTLRVLRFQLKSH